MGWGRRNDDSFDDYQKPFLGRVLDDALGLLWIILSAPFRLVAWILFEVFIGAPFRIVQGLIESLFGRNRSTSIRNLALGFPALVCGCGLIALTVFVWRTPAATIAGRYRAAGKEAKDAGKIDSALLYYSRLRLLEPSNYESIYQLALLNEMKGRRDLARNHMQQITPQDELGHPDARLWLAQDLMAMASGTREIEQARMHILKILTAMPNHPAANIVMAALDRRSGRASEAERRLRLVANVAPIARLQLADLLFTMKGREQEAMQQAAGARDEFLVRLKLRADDHQVRRDLVRALLYTREFQQALATVEQGAQQYPDQHFDRLAAHVLFYWGSQLGKNGPERWQRFSEAIDRSPKSGFVWGSLLKIGLDDPRDEQALRNMLTTLNKRNEHASGAWLVLGFLELHRGSQSDGMAALQHAKKIDSDSAVFGRRIITEARLSPTTALDLASAVCKVWPGPDSIQYRAQWLLEAKKPQEALVELEQISESQKNDPLYFFVLSQACERVGLFDKAKEHRTRAATLSVVQAATKKQEDNPE
jgi:tetratricopeptide (TPR) repeat protein